MGKFYQYNDNIASKVEWRTANQPSVLAWRKKGLQDGGRDLKFRKFMFYTFLGLFTSFFFALGLLEKKDIIALICVGVVMVSFFSSLIYLGLLGGDVFNYRLTDTSFEQASWNDYLPFAKKIFQIPLWLIGIAMVFIVLLNPAAILGVGLGGMIGIGLVAGATVFSKSYEERNLNFQFFSTDWSLMAHRVEIDKKRRIVVFWSENLNHKKHNIAQFSVFCTQQNFEQISQIIISKAQAKQLPINYCQILLKSAPRLWCKSAPPKNDV